MVICPLPEGFSELGTDYNNNDSRAEHIMQVAEDWLKRYCDLLYLLITDDRMRHIRLFEVSDLFVG